MDRLSHCWVNLRVSRYSKREGLRPLFIVEATLLLLILMLYCPTEQTQSVDWIGNLANIFSTAITPDGRIYFVNTVEGTVYQTNLNGDALPSIGSKGQGPEEFNWPENIYYDDPYLYVYDGAKGIMFQIKDGVFLKRWRIDNINTFAIRKDRLYASLRIPKEGHIFSMGHISKDEINVDRYLGGIPCCIRVSGSKKAAILPLSNGNVWMAHTGDFLLRQYDANGRLLKEIDGDPPDYVAPKNGIDTSRFDVQGRAAEIMKFDKIRSFYQWGNHILLYRAKHLNDSHLDVFTRSGKRIATKRIDKIKPVGFHDGTLYGLLRGNETTAWDIMLVKVYQDGEK